MSWVGMFISARQSFMRASRVWDRERYVTSPVAVTLGELLSTSDLTGGKRGRFAFVSNTLSSRALMCRRWSSCNVGKDARPYSSTSGSTARPSSSRTLRLCQSLVCASMAKLFSAPAEYFIRRRSGQLCRSSSLKVADEGSSPKSPSGKSTYRRLGRAETARARSALQVSLVMYGTLRISTRLPK